MTTLKLYRFALSGHSHRAELFMSLLGLDYELIDISNGQHKSEAFLTKNSFGQLPILDDGSTSIADSNAILVYLANKYDDSKQWLPSDALQAAQVQQFLSLAAGKIAFGPAQARLVKLFNAPHNYDNAVAIARDTFTTLNKHLQGRDWLVSKNPTLADIANYTYIAHAPEGGIALDDYPNIIAWLKRIESLPGFVGMKKSAVN